MNTFFLITLSMIGLISSQMPPIPNVYDYSSANSLVNYLLAHTNYYYTPKSLFFQSNWYIPYEQSLQILAIMDNIYEKYNLNGVFLVVSDEAQILDISGYAASVVDLLNQKGVYHKENCYTIILYYTIGIVRPGDYWGLQISIASGDNASHYLSGSDAKEVMDKWGKTLKQYTYDNLVNFMADIEGKMDFQAEIDALPLGAKIAIIVIVIVVLIIAAVVSMICRRVCGCGLGGKVVSGNTGAQTQNYAGGIQVTTGTY